MNAWFKARKLPAYALLALSTPVLMIIVAGSQLPLPFQPPLAVPIRVAPQVAILTAVGCGVFFSTRTRLEAAASRPVQLMEVAVALTVIAAVAVLCIGAELFGLTGAGIATARNIMGFSGLLFIGLRFSLSLAALLPTAVAVLSVIFARSLDTTPEVWAWPVAAATNPVSWAWASGLFIIGLGLLATTRNGRSLSRS